jgi:hypothetical protein
VSRLGVSELQREVRFEVFTAVTMKNGVFWVVTPCGSCKNQEPHGVTTQKTPFFKEKICLLLVCNDRLVRAEHPITFPSYFMLYNPHCTNCMNK